MSEEWTVRAEGLSKKFGLSLRRSMQYGLRDSLTQLAGIRVDGQQLRDGEFWAVKDVSFELKRGESLGIMGVNGSGKSTLLRLMTGVYRPDVGKVALRGNIGSLIAAGAGFAPMLTGRENIMVNGTLLGMSRDKIKRSIDEIIAFAELDGFLDMPVKNYSSGMGVRLGFAIAAMSEPDVLIVDEVLAVGDINFQKKCYDYLFRLRRSGTTIVLVSHSVGAVWSVCDRGLLLHKGEPSLHDSVESLIHAYEKQNALGAIASVNAVAKVSQDAPDPTAPENLSSSYGATRGGTGDAVLTNLAVLNADGGAQAELAFGEPFIIDVDLDVKRTIEKPIIRFTIDAIHYRFICVLDSLEEGLDLPEISPGTYRVRVSVPQQNFRPGAYKVNCAVVGRYSGTHIFYWFNSGTFLVNAPTDRFLYADDNSVMHLSADFTLQPSATVESCPS